MWWSWGRNSPVMNSLSRLSRRWQSAAAMPLIEKQYACRVDAMPRTLIRELPQLQPGTEVTLSGWLQSVRYFSYFLYPLTLSHSSPSGAHLVFAELRDSTGSMQLVFDEETGAGLKRVLMKDCPPESAVTVRGRLRERPARDQRGTAEEAPLRRLEVAAAGLEVVNPALELPFEPHGSVLPSEDFRLRHRHLDLRRPALQSALQLRSDVNYWTHGYWRSAGFTEVETPLLFKSTPEGAKEYAVPLADGTSWALPQSPQQFKQLLMAGGVNRYYQLARCFRQEDLRADRQPEFTQLDVEMSWVREVEEVMGPLEQYVKGVLKEFAGIHVTEAFPRIQYQQAMAAYGCDKPDIRYAFEIVRVAEEGERVLEALALGHLPANLRPDTEASALLPPLSEADMTGLEQAFPGQRDGLYACWRPSRCHAGSTALGKLRTAAIRKIEAAGAQAAYRDDMVPGRGFCWVHSFPLLKPADGQVDGRRRYKAMHHPFTAPHPDDLHLLDRDPLAVRGLHYDLVWNGVEIAGGSLRIHSPALQHRILATVMGMGEEETGRFGHLMAALRSGCPPHGGLALGMDRFLAMLVGAQSIREVIAFPKNSKGVDLCVGAPN